MALSDKIKLKTRIESIQDVIEMNDIEINEQFPNQEERVK